MVATFTRCITSTYMCDVITEKVDEAYSVNV